MKEKEKEEKEENKEEEKFLRTGRRGGVDQTKLVQEVLAFLLTSSLTIYNVFFALSEPEKEECMGRGRGGVGGNCKLFAEVSRTGPL